MNSWDARSEEEEGLNALSHGVWTVMALCSYFWALSSGALGLSIASWGAIISGLTSTIYHACPMDDALGRDTTRRLDKTGIFIAIGAGALGFGIELGSTALLYSVGVALSMHAVAWAYFRGRIRDDRTESWYAVGAGSVVPILIMTIWIYPDTRLPFGGAVIYLLGWICYRIGDSVPWSHTVWHFAVIFGWLAHTLFLSQFTTL